LVGETRLAASRVRGWGESESIGVFLALVPSLSLFGMGILLIAKAALGDRLDLSVFRLVASLLVLPAALALLMALVSATRTLERVLPAWRLRTAPLIALLVIVAPALLVGVLPLGQSAETASDQDAGARIAVVSARPPSQPVGLLAEAPTPDTSVREEEEAAPRRGYCLGGVFYDLLAGQPDYDPNYRGAVLAHVDPETGAVSCDPPS
jgi:hypothetical protein